MLPYVEHQTNPSGEFQNILLHGELTATSKDAELLQLYA